MSGKKVDDLKSTLLVLGLGGSLAAAFAGLHIMARDLVDDSQQRMLAELKRDAPAGCVIEERVQAYECSPDGLMICDRYIPRLVCTQDADQSDVDAYRNKHRIDVVYSAEKGSR